MSPQLQTILDSIQNAADLSELEKESLIKKIKEADKAQSLSQFKLDRLEKDRNTLTIMLQESIEDLQKKSRAIEEQNRELEIESSLEKVRTVAMGMRKRDDMLDICRIISEQLELLGIKEIRNVQTAIFYKHKGTYINYEYYRLHDKALVTEVNYTKDEMSVEFAARMIKGADEVFVRRLEGQQVKDWLNIQRTTNVFIDTNLENARSLTYYWFSLGPVAIGMSAYDPLSEEEIALFKRFRNVFDLAYRRYLDIEKAEAQAREAQIEAALEKVRSRSLAMHKSDELQQVVHAVFERLNELDFELDTAIIIIFAEGSKDTVWWLQNSANQQYLRIAVDYADILYLRNLFEAKENKKDLPPAFYSFEQKNELLNYLFDHTDFRFTPPEQREFLLQKEWATMSAAIANNTAIHITRYSKKSFSEKEDDILKKFSNVFEQAYTRFLDLQTAEAQAREAQIEAALERVRSQSMAMRTSEELKNVVKELRKQIGLLGQQELDTCVIQLYDESPDYIHSLASMKPIESNEEIRDFDRPIPKKGLLIHEEALQAYSSGRKDYILFNEKRKLEQWIDFLKKTYPDIYSVFISTYGAKPEHVPSYWSFSDFNGGSLCMVTLTPPTDIPRALLRRFANVFGQAYRRYVDIKQAEAQAREARIEAALEKIRSSSLAMHHSDEIKNVVAILFEKLKALGLIFDGGAAIHFFKQGSRDALICVISPELSAPIFNNLPYDEDAFVNNPIILDVWKAKDTGEHIINRIYSFEQKNRYFEYVFKHNDDNTRQSQSLREFIFNARSYTATFITEKNSLLGASSWTEELFSETDIEVLKRVARVFEQAYIRFLDLQKAEAQAKESQIQLALERVRARTMAMQRSEELSEAVYVLFQQFRDLGENPDQATIGIINEEEQVIEYWVTMYGNQVDRVFKFPFDEPHVTNKIYKAWKGQNKSLVIELSGKDLYEFTTYRESMGGAKHNPEEKRRIINVAFFSKGLLNVQSNQTRSDESIRLLERFAAVFDQTYTRFLDLQKAEAQARESQIQLALERVRARTMAMHHSSELSEAATLVFELLSQLGAELWSCGFNICKEDSEVVERWMSLPNGKMLDPLQVPLSSGPGEQIMYDAWKNGVELFTFVQEGAELHDGFESLKSHPSTAIIYTRLKQTGIPIPTWMQHFVASFKQGSLWIMATKPFDETQIFVRFAKVFEQTYTRFLDLQKAEAQARESQIELGLERVRARAMAMQKSDDLAGAVAIIFEELDKLNIGILRCGIGILNKENRSVNVWTTSKSDENTTVQISGDESMDSHPLLQGAFNAWLKQEEYSYVLHGKDLINYYKAQAAANFKLPDSQSLITANEDLYQYYFLATFQAGGLFAFRETPFPDEAKNVMKRFAGVFNLTYERFLDLQKAEARAREAQIEAALERVRARAMAMHKSDELMEVANEMRNQLSLLGQKELETCAIHLYEVAAEYFESWAALRPPDNEGEIVQTQAFFPKKGIKIIEEAIHHYLAGDKDYVLTVDGAMSIEFFEIMKQCAPDAYAVLSETIKDKNVDEILNYWSVSDFSGGSLVMGTRVWPDENSRTLLQRFANVFGLAYRRFVDLQQAEAQARESQIQLALERVRARTMAMQKSDELADVAELLFKQVNDLGIKTWTTGFNVWSEDDNFYTDYITNPQGGFMQPYTIDAAKLPVTIEVSNAKKRGDEFLVNYEEGESLAETYRQLTKFGEKQFASILESGFEFPTHQYEHFVFGAKVSLMFITYDPVPEAHDMFKRFGKVFEQTYTRFLDLQRAEAQAREAKIEAALERTRTQSMIMQHSQELDVTLRVFHEQVLLLGIHSAFSFLWLPDEEKDRHIFWAAWAENNLKDFKSKAINYPLDRNEPATKQCLVDWKSDQPVVSYHVPPAGVESYFATWQELIAGVDELKPKNFSDGLYYVEAFMKYGCFGVMAKSDLSEDEKKILYRFTIEFERTYTRFLDLQKAEAQTREAQIEAALERVRSRTMAMQRSDELANVTQLLFQQVKDLGITAWTAGFNIWQEDNASYIDWLTGPTGEFLEPYLVDTTTHPVFAAVRDARQRGDGFFVSFVEGKAITEIYELLNSFGNKGQFQKMLDSGIQFPTHQYNHFVFGAQVSLLFITYEACPEEWDIYKRFGKVFEQTYTRFLDLQKAEAQAKEAQIETALERVRSRTLAMQKSDELAETAAVLFKQLILLGIEPNRLYINIIKDETGEAESWITDEDGSKISMAYTTNMNANPTFKKMYDGWKTQNRSMVIDMQGKELKEYFKHLSSLNVSFKGGLSQKRRLQYIAYFSKGFIGMASPDEQPAETMQLLERFAAVFNLTFTRFNDLKIAEAHALQAELDLVEIKAAKKKAEDALTELKATQTQLIQSEKMASLGELTAGIAHEIQNPLNFVNNFSEVSNELLDEMKTELEKGNKKDAAAIIQDVKQNLEKILHHGKRADAIVKGMLQHSRTSSSQKELTDINVLADEYLRLAYHGLRAKDKSFNAKFITDFDKNVDKVNVIPQEIGRVILNLINNAFYAVNERQKVEGVGYEPTVAISTASIQPPLGPARAGTDGGRSVQIKVSDNGGGIPQKNLDKIFQPFFTTKPTGQGTGLGLSLAYDIVTKGHNGEMKVETQEGEGSKFIVIIPSTQ